MTKHLTLLLFIGLAWGQLDTLWTKSFGEEEYYDVGQETIETQDGGYVIAGRLVNESCLIKLNEQGDEQWIRLLGGTSANCLIQLTSGDYLIGGSDNYENARLIKVDSLGSPIWVQSYENLRSFNSIIKANDDGYLLTGYNGDGVLTKIDSSGTILWSNIYENESVLSVKIVSAYTYIIGGSYLRLIDLNGNHIWERIFQSVAFNTVSDGGYISVGDHADGNPIKKFDANGLLLWTNYIDTVMYCHAITEMSNGSFIFIGETDSNPSSIIIGSVDADGDSSIIKTYSHSLGGYSKGYSIYKTSDNYFIASGTGSGNIWFLIISTDESLNLKRTINLPSIFSLKQNYPTPFNPITTLKYVLPEDSFVDMTVYDMLGNVVNNLINKNQSSGSKSVQWDATNNQGEPVSAGVYLYKINAGKFSQTKKMILLK